MQVFLPIAIIAAASGLLFSLAVRDRRWTLARAERAAAERAAEEAEREAFRDRVIEEWQRVMREHLPTLFLQVRQKLYRDPYGRVVSGKAEAELNYFYENVLVPSLEEPKTGESWRLVRQLFDTWALELDYESIASPAGGEVEQRRSDGRTFERQLGASLASAGYNVTFTPATGDQGVDLLVERKGRRIAVQCKDYAKPVGNDAIQQVFAGAQFYGAAEAIVVAPNGYTTSARQLAESLGVRCLHQDEVLQTLESAVA